MAIVAADIDYKLSGGAANADGNLSIGGVLSANDMGEALHDLFDVVGSSEASAGDTEYRCIYIQNNHGTITAQNIKAFILSQTTSPDTSFEIGLGVAGANTAEATIADENTAPASVVFSAPADDASGLDIPDLAPGDYFGLWIKRIVNAASAAFNADTASLRVSVDTAA